MSQQVRKAKRPLLSTPEQLGARLVESLRSGNDAGGDRLLHPAMRSCKTLSDPDYKAAIARTRKESQKYVSGPYHVRVYEDTDSTGNAAAYGPVRPAMRMQIQFEGTPFGIVRDIARSGQEWLIVQPCFTSVGLAPFRKSGTSK
ncbi:MAG TPA: hypothetical protein VNJ04_03300 [Gemmatimonadaceae bacterium]|nr:hypothetical protein [Gemmatimonadaceae bacterium]